METELTPQISSRSRLRYYMEQFATSSVLWMDQPAGLSVFSGAQKYTLKEKQRTGKRWVLLLPGIEY